MKRWPNVVLMLGQCRKQWDYIKPTGSQVNVFTGPLNVLSFANKYVSPKIQKSRGDFETLMAGIRSLFEFWSLKFSQKFVMAAKKLICYFLILLQ